MSRSLTIRNNFSRRDLLRAGAVSLFASGLVFDPFRMLAAKQLPPITIDEKPDSVLKIYSGSEPGTGTVLATIPIYRKHTTRRNSVAAEGRGLIDMTGVANSFRIFTDDEWRVQGSCGGPGEHADFSLNNKHLIAAGEVAVDFQFSVNILPDRFSRHAGLESPNLAMARAVLGYEE